MKNKRGDGDAVSREVGADAVSVALAAIGKGFMALSKAVEEAPAQSPVETPRRSPVESPVRSPVETPAPVEVEKRETSGERMARLERERQRRAREADQEARLSMVRMMGASRA